jgi:hypothetical protein
VRFVVLVEAHDQILLALTDPHAADRSRIRARARNG